MRTRLGLLTALILGTACSSAPASYQPASSAAASASRTGALPSPTASAQPDQDHFAAVYGSGMGIGQTLTIIGADGRLHGQVVNQLGRIGGDVQPPYTSTTNSAVYYLDGNRLMRLEPDGTPVHIRDLPGSSTVRVAFAVSSDDKRIAIALLTYGPTPSPGPGVTGPKYVGMKLYVEDLDGSHHVDLFSSSTAFEWPVGWHGSDLVVAVGSNVYGGGSLVPYPYYAFNGIHVADSTTGVRKAVLCGGQPAVGLGTSKGILCAKANGLGPTTITPVPMAFSDWSGNETDLGLNCIYSGLQPAGDDFACDTNSGGFVVSPGGAQQPFPKPSTGSDPYNLVCWVGHDHLLLTSRSVGTVLYDIVTRSTQQIDVRADWTVGAIPGGF